MRPVYVWLFITVLALPLSVYGQIHEKTESVLSSGDWYKIAVAAEGIYEIDKEFIDLTGISAKDAAELRVFGNKGGMLPQLVIAERTDDLSELPTLREGLEDGSFDANDRILFFAQGPSVLSVDGGNMSRAMNIYDTRNHYFLGVGLDGQPLIIEDTGSLNDPDVSYDNFDDYVRIEEDRINLLGKFRPPGSGKQWYGDEFSASRLREYNIEIPDIIAGEGASLRVGFAGRAGASSTIQAVVNGNSFSKSLSKVNLGNVESSFARVTTISGEYVADKDIQEITISYPAVAGTTTEGWLDYISVQAKRQLKIANGPLQFRVLSSANFVNAGYVLGNIAPNYLIWDITDPLKTRNQLFELNGNTATFGSNAEGIVRHYIAFNPNGDTKRPDLVGAVPNQNIHGLMSADLVVVYHPDFLDAAMQIAQHRVDYSGFNVAVIDINHIMNEFAGGSMDPSGLRDFAAMLKKRDPGFRYMLLVGDGSYDYRHLNSDQDDDNFIPVYETAESMNPIRSFPSDDYYALLNETEGETLLGAIDIAVGRLTVGSVAEAETVIEKIIHYDVSPTTYGDWRQRLTYVADDEDSNLHLNQSEEISDLVEEDNKKYDIDRIYLDAYPQESTPGGPRYPQANAAINNSVFQGVLAINYLGHGGRQGWTQERVLGIDDIQSWSNFDKLPLVVTATCSFTGYDEPSYRSAGEEVLLNPDGGGIGLLTTVRAVYSSSNKRLTEAVFERLFDKDNGKHLPIGEIMRRAKNSNSRDTVDINARKFAIIGDPSMTLAYPEHDIVVTEINGIATGATPDTIGALEEFRLAGEVRNVEGSKLEAFNGTASVTVYDKRTVIKTLANDPKSFEREFDNFSRIVFKGTATVTNGEFEIGFVVPEDIDFNYGNGRISIYATDGYSTDAAGSYEDFIIGGASGDGKTDVTGPVVNAYMNNESFRSGDVVSPNSTLLVKLYDENGINVTGNSIGHDLVAVLNEDNNQSFVLNDFYEANENDFTRGEVRFPFANLPAGKHSITVTAWDVANNFSEATIEFRVDDNPDNAIRSITAYPNPATQSQRPVFRIEHNLGISVADVEIEMFDVTGREVNRIFVENVPSQDGIIDNISWGIENSQNLADGVGILFYRARIFTSGANNQQKIYEGPFNKLVLLN